MESKFVNHKLKPVSATLCGGLIMILSQDFGFTPQLSFLSCAVIGIYICIDTILQKEQIFRSNL
jgi:hypothetical protein